MEITSGFGTLVLMERAQCMEVNFIVDTGSTYTWVGRDKLRELGIKPASERRFRTMKGKIIKRKISEAIVEFKGEKPQP